MFAPQRPGMGSQRFRKQIPGASPPKDQLQSKYHRTPNKAPIRKNRASSAVLRSGQ